MGGTGEHTYHNIDGIENEGEHDEPDEHSNSGDIHTQD